MKAQLLFILFIFDTYKDIGSGKVKFADDGTIWRKGKDIIPVGQLLEQDVIKILSRTAKWRMKISIEKTEVCFFPKTKRLPK